jgi:hypothetical protein
VVVPKWAGEEEGAPALVGGAGDDGEGAAEALLARVLDGDGGDDERTLPRARTAPRAAPAPTECHALGSLDNATFGLIKARRRRWWAMRARERESQLIADASFLFSFLVLIFAGTAGQA